MAFAPYASLDEFKLWQKISDGIDDAQASDVLIAVTRWIDERCQRHFWQDTAVARTFTPTAWWCLDLGTFNDLVSVTAVKTDEAGDGVFEVTWSPSDYQLTPTNPHPGRPYTGIKAVAARSFPVWCGYGPTRQNRVEITGTWGWAAVPDAVQQACLIQSTRVLGRRNSPEGIAGGFGEFGAMRMGRVDPDVEALLMPYVHPSAAVLVA